MRIEPKMMSSTSEKRQRAKYVWRCEICDRCLCSKRSYLEHKNTHIAARPFKCEFCHYAAASQMTLRRHTLRQHVPRHRWHYPCPYCDQAFVEPTSYQAHLRHKHSGCSGTYGCDLCDYKTLSYKNFADHYVSKHSDSRSARPISHVVNEKRYLNKHLIEDELGVGWDQRPAQAAVDEQLASLRRLATLEQERRRKVQAQRRPKVPGRHVGLFQPEYPYQRQSNADFEFELVSKRHRDVEDIGGPMDHQYGNTAGPKSLFSTDQPCVLVPDAECYVEVETASEGMRGAIRVENEDTRSISSESSENEEEDSEEDEDSVSLASDQGELEIGTRISALTAEIDQAIAASANFDEGDLGNDVLPDGQVDFDLD